MTIGCARIALASALMSAPPGECSCGSWPTPITSEVVVQEAVRLGGATVDGEDVVWSEGRPDEGGRTTLVRLSPDGRREELLAPGENARTAVHEYGGGAWWVRDGVVQGRRWQAPGRSGTGRV